MAQLTLIGESGTGGTAGFTAGEVGAVDAGMVAGGHFSPGAQAGWAAAISGRRCSAPGCVHANSIPNVHASAA